MSIHVYIGELHFLLCPKENKVKGREEEGKIGKDKQKRKNACEVSTKGKSTKKYSVIQIPTNLYDRL